MYFPALEAFYVMGIRTCSNCFTNKISGNLKAIRLEEYVRSIVSTVPALTNEQLATIAKLLIRGTE
jgi:hypothetical protein